MLLAILVQTYDFWRDSIWQFIGVAASLVISVPSLIVAVVAYHKQRNRKAIGYKIVSDIPILSISKEVRGRTEILFDGKPINYIHLLILEVRNSGDIPIVSDDFLEPITFSFGDRVEVLDAEIVEVDPSNLKAILKQGQKNVSLEIHLFNKSDVIKFKVLLSDIKEYVRCEARIIGVKNMVELTSKNRNPLLILAPLRANVLVNNVRHGSNECDNLNSLGNPRLILNPLRKPSRN
jgi:hypothetical protein